MSMSLEEFLEHHGVRGMKWGQRKTAKAQKNIDSIHRVATGTATSADRRRAANNSGVVTKKSAVKLLQRGAKAQQKVSVGKGKVIDILAKSQGIKISELNYHQNP